MTLPNLLTAGCGGDNDDRIARVAIHPALGIGRVGNGPEAMYFGPEVPGAVRRAPHGFKDANGAVARQAARFRIYGLDASGRPVRELTAHDADITWRLTVANAKPAWYAFSTAFDIPDAVVSELVGADSKARWSCHPPSTALLPHGEEDRCPKSAAADRVWIGPFSRSVSRRQP